MRSTGTGSITYHTPNLMRNLRREIQYHRGIPRRRRHRSRPGARRAALPVITIAAFFGREPHIGVQKGFTRPFVQTGRKRDGQLPDTPTLID